MEYKDLKEMPSADLTRELARAREELRAARFRVRVGEDRRVRAIRVLRARIARILTALAAPSKPATPTT